MLGARCPTRYTPRCWRSRLPVRTRHLISSAVTPVRSSSARVTTPCAALAIRANSSSTVLSWGHIDPLKQDAPRPRPPPIASAAMFVFKAAVVGAGTMGGEIAQVIAAAGIPVVLKDVKQEFVDTGLEKARQVTEAQLGGLVSKEKITQEDADRQREEILGRITGTTEYDGFGDVDFVIEAVPERMDIKQSVFAELDEVTPGHAILASNTSSLSITEMGEATIRPDKVCGFHFFWPASMMRLVEVIEGEETSDETLQTAANFAQSIRKTAIRCGEVPGFVVNRVLNSGVSEVWRVVDEEELDYKDVDKLVQESKAAPMGPYFLADLLGLDTVLHVAEYLRDSYGDRFYVSPKMRQLVEAGDLGHK